MPLRYIFYSKFSFAGKQLIDDDDNSIRISGVRIVVRETRYLKIRLESPLKVRQQRLLAAVNSDSRIEFRVNQ